MLYRVTVVNELGKFESKAVEVSQDKFEEVRQLFEQINLLSYLRLEAEDGVEVYFPGTLLKRSVVYIEPIEKPLTS